MTRKKNKDTRDLQLGDHLYYSSFSQNPQQLRALVNTSKNALSPYYNFLTKAIEAEEKKGSYEVDWKYIESNYTLKIEPLFSKFKINKPKTVLKIIMEDDLKESRNKLFFDKQDKTIRFDKSSIKIEGNSIYFDIDTLPINNEIIEINNQEVEYELIEVQLYEKDKLVNNNQIHSIEKIESLDDGWNVEIKTSTNIKEAIYKGQKLTLSKYLVSFDKLYDEDNIFTYEKVGQDYSSETLPKSKTLKDKNGTEYKWTKQKKTNKQDIVIQLIDNDGNDNEKSVSEYFFEDDVLSIYQGKNKKDSFSIKHKKNDEKILILAQDWKRPKDLVENQAIKISVDTNNLKRQQRSIKTLNDSPVKEQKNLIKLFEQKSGRLWENPRTKDIGHWYILNDESYDGTLDQREFVKKAIATDDFAILEGPPGSGKTTTILELILQLLKEGKKVLLSASTHVAIDNVLERIEEYDKENIVEPLRIGREGSVGESIQHLQIDNKVQKYKANGMSEELATELVLDGANLVCGTTMGINQLPAIRNKKDNKLPTNPIFDYMIIDESSKTTFQEFLVPAMLAKKWILVGDIKQLSPFIEQSHIIHNLKVAIPKDTQTAIRIIFEMIYNNPNPYILEVSQKEEKEIKKYLDYWNEKENSPYKNRVVSYSNEEDLFKRLGSDLILVKEGSWSEVKHGMPKTHIVILKNEKEDDSFFFKQMYLNRKRKLPNYKLRDDKDISRKNSPIEYKELLKKSLKEKSWADEIAWRMIRVYERRMLKNPDSYYEKTYELLKPVDENNAVDRIYNMTLPSILESLQVGNGEKHRNRTTITEGFDRRDLKERHETLKTQHRMASDISKFSREEFYTNDDGVALKDASTINREWNYREYDKRAVWLDVPKQNKQNDRQHQDEVNVIMEEIKKFLAFVKNNPKNQQNESWSIGVLTFYKPQEKLLREGLRKLCSQPNKMSRFSKDGVEILNYTVDKFQGMEADIIFLSMVRGKSIGFMDNINRLNVALTRAKYQRVIVGDQAFFKKQNGSKELKKLAQNGGM